MNYQIDLPNDIKEQIPFQQNILWYAKPSKRFSTIDLFNMIIGIIVILSAAGLNDLNYAEYTIAERIIILLRTSYPFGLIYLIIYIAIRLVINRHTWFIITNERVIRISKYGSSTHITHKSLNEIHHFEVRYYGHIANLYLGKYRYPFYGRYRRFNYESGHMENWIHVDAERLKRQKYLLESFNFFDLLDVDTPAQIIREHCPNAKEYFDPKRNKLKHK